MQAPLHYPKTGESRSFFAGVQLLSHLRFFLPHRQVSGGFGAASPHDKATG